MVSQTERAEQENKQLRNDGLIRKTRAWHDKRQEHEKQHKSYTVRQRSLSDTRNRSEQTVQVLWNYRSGGKFHCEKITVDRLSKLTVKFVNFKIRHKITFAM